VVRAVSECSIPIVAGIGHQRDESLADLVADVYAHTPTAAAEQTVPLLADVYAEHQERIAILSRTMTSTLDQAYEDLERLRSRLQRLHLDRQIRQETQSIAWVHQRLVQSTHQRLQQAIQHCQLLRQKLITLDPKSVLQRGYAMVRQEQNGTTVRSATDVTLGQALTIQLASGRLKVTVTELHADSPSEDLPSHNQP
jgi:exodeoxyribonuclease VII large subunit